MATQRSLFDPEPMAPDDAPPPAPGFKEALEKLEAGKRAAALEAARSYRVRVFPSRFRAYDRRVNEDELQPFVGQLLKWLNTKHDATILIERQGVVYQYIEWDARIAGWTMTTEDS